ncbi:hypothetical protein [Lentibacillus sp. CBA3610]|uniref:hypothetical protein n=1 Tax=Lentibacillus sp. CBA3610 TaxID=2518176 RepID=UPI0015959532|nr:hypothetical protein [Lentibacillus sp. CBA3610]QKY70190.1 hypothetical protein Len3610_11835 [Lentibacillus sp. CBA3610]
MQLLDEYKEMRQDIRDLNSLILEDVEKSYILKAAETLGVLENGSVVLESHPEQDAFYDFIVYGKMMDGKSTLSHYMEKNLSHEDDDQLLNIMKDSEVSLYKIDHVDRENKTIRLINVADSSLTHEVIDLSLSQTVTENMLICTRLLHFESFSMTSGLLFLFKADHLEYLRKRSRKMIKKMNKGNASDKRFVAYFKLNRKDGLPTAMEDVE